MPRRCRKTGFPSSKSLRQLLRERSRVLNSDKIGSGRHRFECRKQTLSASSSRRRAQLSQFPLTFPTYCYRLVSSFRRVDYAAVRAGIVIQGT